MDFLPGWATCIVGDRSQEGVIEKLHKEKAILQSEPLTSEEKRHVGRIVSRRVSSGGRRLAILCMCYVLVVVAAAAFGDGEASASQRCPKIAFYSSAKLTKRSLFTNKVAHFKHVDKQSI